MKIINAVQPQLPISSEFPLLTDPLESLKQQRLRELIDALESSGPTPIVCAVLLGIPCPEMMLSNEDMVVKVRVDWMDYGPWSNGLPATHFRVDVKRAGAYGSSKETRHVSTEAAAALIVSALAREEEQ